MPHTFVRTKSTLEGKLSRNQFTTLPDRGKQHGGRGQCDLAAAGKQPSTKGGHHDEVGAEGQGQHTLDGVSDEGGAERETEIGQHGMKGSKNQ